MRLAGLTDVQIHLLCTPFVNLSPSERSNAFSASDKLAEWNRKQPYRMTGGITVMDRDALLKDNIQSPADGKRYSNRKDWNEMLKRNNCIEFGNDQKVQARPTQIKNMNLKPAIAAALRKHGVING